MSCLRPPVMVPHLRMPTVFCCPWRLFLLPLPAELLLSSLFITCLTKLLSSGQRNNTNQPIHVLYSDVICCPYLCIKFCHSLFLLPADVFAVPLSWPLLSACSGCAFPLSGSHLCCSPFCLVFLAALQFQVPKEEECSFMHTGCHWTWPS